MPSGILLLDKPRGLSSNAALQRVRRLWNGVKAGHVGSLDPLATGMLPICLGEATKVAGDILAGRKRYRFTVSLGTRTATGDAEGAVTATAAVPALTRPGVEALLPSFLGESLQTPPMFSALKRGGEPLYRLARAGITVERTPRTIEIFELALGGLDATSLELEACCSKGTYIRVLAEDLAQRLGTCGHVSALRRLSVEPFANEAMHTLESLEFNSLAGRLPPLLPVDWPLKDLPALQLAAADAVRVRHGQAVTAAGTEGRVRLYDAAGQFLGIGARDSSGTVRPRRLLNT
ncbi:MAG: tRNA pseudouridine(55) synthase TruB [Steroidobacteraceae bacterium]